MEGKRDADTQETRSQCRCIVENNCDYCGRDFKTQNGLKIHCVAKHSAEMEVTKQQMNADYDLDRAKIKLLVDELAGSISKLCHAVIAKRLNQFFAVIDDEMQKRP